MPWASVVGSYGRPGESATRSRSPRRTRWRPLGLARRSGMRPSRTARRIVSSQTPFSRAASWMSISSSSWAAAAATSFLRRASRAAAACSAPFSRSVSVSRCASRMKAASQGGRPLGSSRPSEPGILDAVLLPDPVARFGRHCPALFGDPEGDLLEILLAAQLGVPGAKDLGAVPASTEAITDHLDLAFRWIETAEVGPHVVFAVQLAPQYDDPCARSVARQDLVDGVGGAPKWSRYGFRGFRLHFAFQSAGQIRQKPCQNSGRTVLERR